MRFCLLFTLLFAPSQLHLVNWTSMDLKANFKHRFVIQNLASLTIRVYQRNCDFNENCANTLIFQAPMVIGKDEDESRSKLGFFKISRWNNFHKDYEGKYLGWNQKPKPVNSSRSDWNKTGPFGWYTAFLEPNAKGQWMHGTIGWGSEGEKFINHNRSPSGNFDRIRSNGCTRVSNQSIAFLRNFVPENSLVLKIYALEDFQDPKLTQYQTTPFYNYWTYSLSKKKMNSAEQYPLEKFNIPFYEQGRLFYSQYPVKFEIKTKEEYLKKIKNYNPYDLSKKDFKGKFLVDSGLLINYEHPRKLEDNGNKIAKYFYVNINHLALSSK